jgi:hypothetical protein
MTKVVVPIFFINRNRYKPLKEFVEWLLLNGQNKITIIDNNSTYKPLLTWYQKMERDNRLKVFYMKGNEGPWVFWKNNFHQGMTSPYIVSDSDLSPTDYCPNDLVEYMHEILQTTKRLDKLGPALRLDDIPDHYSKKKQVMMWESRFWHIPIGRNLYLAPIDTTFAIYRPNLEFKIDQTKNARTGFPYVLKHNPWYVNDNALEEEEIYYRAHADHNMISWGSDKFNSRFSDLLTKIEKISTNAITVNLLSGNNYVPGWINVESEEYPNDILISNFIEQGFSLPESSVDRIYCGVGVIERLRDRRLFEGIHRVLKADGKVYIRGPHISSDSGMVYHQGISELTFENLDRASPEFPVAMPPRYDFIKVQQKIFLADGVAQNGTVSRTKLQRERNVIGEISVVLRNVKPARERTRLRGTRGSVSLKSEVTDDFFEPPQW